MRGARAFLKGESFSPDLTRRGNPQRFPLHTTPSLRKEKLCRRFFVAEEDVGSAGFSKGENMSSFCPYGGVTGHYTGVNMFFIHEIRGEVRRIFGEKHNWEMDASK